MRLEYATKVKVRSNKTFRQHFEEVWKQRELQAMVLPWIIFIFIFCYLPMYGLIMAFQQYRLGDIPGFSQWVGIMHFRMFFNDPQLPLIIRNTFAISFLKLCFCFPLPIILALMLNEVKLTSFKRSVQTISYLPHFVSWVVVAGLTFDLLSVDGGIVNYLLMKAGIVSEPILFLGEKAYFWPILVITDLWKEIGWNAIIYIAAISSIDQELYQAADIDGAGRLAKIWHITLAGIRPTIVILLVLSVGGILNSGFEQILLMTNNLNNTMVYEVSEVIDTYVYRVGISAGRFSYATAAGIFKSVLSVVLLTIANFSARKISGESLW